MDPKLVLIQDIVKVETDYNFAYFYHDLGVTAAVTKVVIEEGEQPFEDLRLEEGLAPHVPF